MQELDSKKFSVRDLRKKQQFILDDAFFNGYVKIVGTNVLGVYCALARHADKQQKAFPSIKHLSEELVLSKPTIIESLKILEYFKIIRKQRIGKMCNNRYWLLDKRYWRKDWAVMSNELTSGEVKQLYFNSKTILLHRLNHLTSNSKEPHSKETHSKDIVAKATKWIFKDELEKLLTDKLKHIQIIGEFIKSKEFILENNDQLQEIISRNVRPAVLLKGYSIKKIREVLKWLRDNADFKWTLETIGKYINEDLTKINSKATCSIK